MPFTPENASAAGKLGGRKNRLGGSNPADARNKALVVKVSQTEFDAITAKAKELNMSKAELVVRAVCIYMTALAHDEGHKR